MPTRDLDPVEHPHDALFRRVFGRAHHLVSLVRAFAPPELVERLELDRLRIDSASFVSDRLKRRASDVVARVPMVGQGELWLVVVCEHQSTPSRWMPLRLLEYDTHIWRRSIRSGRIPVVVSMVVEHGPRSGTGARSVAEMLRVPADDPVLAYTPQFQIVSLDLRETDAASEANRLTPLAQLTLGCLARSHDSARLARVLADLAPIARKAIDFEPGDALAAIRTYIWAIIDEDDVPAFQASVEQLGDDMGTAAQNLIARGRQEGRQEGREEGRQEGARSFFLRQLEERFGPLAPEVLDRVQRADHATIEAWGTRILSARALSDVLD